MITYLCNFAHHRSPSALQKSEMFNDTLSITLSAKSDQTNPHRRIADREQQWLEGVVLVSFSDIVWY